MGGWVDSHCHLQSCRADADAAIARARAAGVEWLVCVGTDLETSRQAVELAGPSCRRSCATVGLHPHDASRLGDEWRRARRAGRATTQVVAVGECGLRPPLRALTPAREQERAFRAQIALARELDRALVIHSREAWDDTFRGPDRRGRARRTVFHCFTGGPEEARTALGLGAHLSFSGIVSFPSADDVRAAAALAPPDRLLVETDAPYLAPVPHRGRENEPALVVAVGRGAGRRPGRSRCEVAAATNAAAAAVFGAAPAPR